MHLYGATFFSQDAGTRRVPLLAAWALEPFSWIQRQEMQERMQIEAKALAQETLFNDQVESSTDAFVALSSGRPAGDALCGVIFTDHAYPQDVAMAVLDKMLEEMAVRMPRAWYQARLNELGVGDNVLGNPLPGNTLWTLPGGLTNQPATTDGPSLERPLLNAAIGFPSAQKYLAQYQDLDLAQSLAKRQRETRTTGGRAAGIVCDRMPSKKRSSLVVRRARRSNKEPDEGMGRRESEHSALSLRSLGRSSGGDPASCRTSITGSPDGMREKSPRCGPSKESKHTVLSPATLHSRSPSHLLRKEPHPTRSLDPDVNAGVSEILAAHDPAITRKSTAETLRAPVDGAAPGALRRSTLSGPAEAPEPRVRASMDAPAPPRGPTRKRSATMTGGDGVTSASYATALIARGQIRLRQPVAANEAELDDERYAAVQESLSKVRSLGVGRSAVSASASVTSDEDTDCDARTPSPMTNMTALRLALAACPCADPERAGRIRMMSSLNPNPEEVVEPMIVEKRFDFLPDLPSDSTECQSSGAERTHPQLHVPFKVRPVASRMRLRRQRQTVQPRVTTPPGSPGKTSSPVPPAPKEHRKSTGTTPLPSTSFPPNSDFPVYKNAEPRGFARTRRLGLGRKRTATPGSEKEDQCLIM